jgi:hypothetical protein
MQHHEAETQIGRGNVIKIRNHISFIERRTWVKGLNSTYKGNKLMKNALPYGQELCGKSYLDISFPSIGQGCQKRSGLWCRDTQKNTMIQ